MLIQTNNEFAFFLTFVCNNCTGHWQLLLADIWYVCSKFHYLWFIGIYRIARKIHNLREQTVLYCGGDNPGLILEAINTACQDYNEHYVFQSVEERGQPRILIWVNRGHLCDLMFYACTQYLVCVIRWVTLYLGIGSWAFFLQDTMI